MGGYYRRYFARLWKELSSKLVDFILVCVATGGSVYLVHLIGLEKGVTDTLGKLGPLLLWVLINAIRTPFLIDKDKQGELEHAQKQLQEEKEKNVKPELVGKATDFQTGFIGSGYFRDAELRLATLELHFAIDVTNRRATQTNVVAVEVDPTKIDSRAEADKVRQKQSNLVFEHGIEKRIEASVSLSFPAEEVEMPGGWRKEYAFDVGDLQVWITDAFGQRVKVEIPRGQVLKF